MTKHNNNEIEFKTNTFIVKSICGAISAFVPPLSLRCDVFAENRRHGSDVCNRRVTLLSS